jgi:hypothetical protein
LFRPGSPRQEVGCWAHARRYFYDARRQDAERAHALLAWIKQLYHLEAQAKEMTLAERLAFLRTPPPAARATDAVLTSARFAQQQAALDALLPQGRLAQDAELRGLADAQVAPAQRWDLIERRRQLDEEVDVQALLLVRLKLRREAAVPLLDDLYQYGDDHKGKVLPKSLIGAAFTYADKHRVALQRYLSDGLLDIDNNVSEQTLRFITIGRNNWLFYGSDAGGRTAAVLVTLTATCKHLGIEPFSYLRDLFTRLPSQPRDRLDELLPDRWAQAQQRAEFLANQVPRPAVPAATGPDPPDSSSPATVDPPGSSVAPSAADPSREPGRPA